MKKPLAMPEEAQPRNITRADLVLTNGYGLEVDGRMKTVFPTLAAAQKRARDLKAEFPMLQVGVFEGVTVTAPVAELPFTIPAIPLCDLRCIATSAAAR